MSLRFLCRLGLHRERRMHSPGGGWFARCTRCGRDRDIRAKLIM